MARPLSCHKSDTSAVELYERIQAFIAGKPIGDVYDICASLLSHIVALEAKSSEGIVADIDKLAGLLKVSALEDFRFLHRRDIQ